MNKRNKIDSLNLNLSNILDNEVKATELGFVDNSCKSSALSILVHCLENIEIFTATQVSKINTMINKLLYG